MKLIKNHDKSQPEGEAGEPNYEAAVAPSENGFFPKWGLGAKYAASEECGECVK